MFFNIYKYRFKVRSHHSVIYFWRYFFLSNSCRFLRILLYLHHKVTSNLLKKLLETLLSKCLSTWLCLMGFCV